MEFVKKEPKKKADDKTSTNATSTTSRKHSNDASDKYSVRVNWLYRPKDISRKSMDPRELFVTMHCDLCPLHSIRGKCIVKCRDHIEDVDEYRNLPNCFWFDKLYDRYIIRFFDVIPTEKITNIPVQMQKILQQRFKYAIMESGRGKELCASPNSCTKCLQWCSPDDSVRCAHCKGHFHMLCVDPPLYKKPSRGFGWSCAACSLELEQKLEAQRPTLPQERKTRDDVNNSESPDDREPSQEGDTEDMPSSQALGSGRESPSGGSPPPVSRYKELEAAIETARTKSETLTKEQQHQLKLWPFRYLGIHAKMEDILDTDDRIHPRAASRLGPKHQAQVPEWPGRPVVYFEPPRAEKKRRGTKGRRGGRGDIQSGGGASDSQFETGTDQANDHAAVVELEDGTVIRSPASIPKKDLPPWLQPKAAGYIERGGDATVTLNWKEPVEHPEVVDEFLKKTEPYAAKLNIAHHSPNFVDACLKALIDSDYDPESALSTVATFSRKSLKEPTFTADEKKRFEEGVKKYGNELHYVYKDVRTKKSADVVRYYYLWKKTPSGHAIWDNYEGRAQNKRRPDLHTHDGLVDEVADAGDESAYDNEKAKAKQRTFVCKFCKTTASREWRRAPGYPAASSENPVVALCIRCSRLWRRYAVVWEEPEAVFKRVGQRGNSTLKRKYEPELIEDARAIMAERDKEIEKLRNRKRARSEKDGINGTSQRSTSVSPPEKSEASPSPSKGKFSAGRTAGKHRTTIVSRRPCFICGATQKNLFQVSCKGCDLTVHGSCYGLSGAPKEWYCDTCTNEHALTASTNYSCVLCPQLSGNDNAAQTRNIPDALKMTYDHNWAHIRCATWNSDIKYGDPSKLTPIEGVAQVLYRSATRKQQCSICKSSVGYCTQCAYCQSKFHIYCAASEGYTFGFEITPVKSNRKDSTNTVCFGNETGVMSPVIMCPNHSDGKAESIHFMCDLDSSTGLTAFQTYCEAYKLSDRGLKGAMKRAALYPPESVVRLPNSTIVPQPVPQDQVALVFSTVQDRSNTALSTANATCVECHSSHAPYFLETATLDDPEAPWLLKCPQCYWNEKDPDAYWDEFESTGINIVGTSTTKSVLELATEKLREITLQTSAHHARISQHFAAAAPPPESAEILTNCFSNSRVANLPPLQQMQLPQNPELARPLLTAPMPASAISNQASYRMFAFYQLLYFCV
jgi:hypothetical protein